MKKEIRRFGVGVVGVSTITDPYQPIEDELRLTRSCIVVLLRSGFHVSIQTKSDLVLRDLDIINRFTNRVDVGLTITTMDNYIAKVIEPKSPPPSRRVRALRRISDLGVETWIFYGPVIPHINDSEDDVEHIIGLAKETKSKVLVDAIHVRKEILPTLSRALEALGKEWVIKELRKDKLSKWWLKFKEEVLRKCNQEKVECIPTYAEPPPKTKTLTNYTTRK